MHTAAAVMASLHLERRTVSMDTTSNVSMDTNDARKGGVGTDAAIMDIELEMSIPDTVLVSSDSNLKDVHALVSEVYNSNDDFDLRDDWLSETNLDDFQSLQRKRLHNKMEEQRARVGSKKKTTFKKSYNLTRKFQTEWSAKLPWCEGVLANDDFLHQVKCIICSTMEKKLKLMAPKWHTLLQHTREHHKQNLLLYATRQPLSVLEQIQGYNSLESKKKWVQFATLFQILSDGRPMC